MATRILEYSGYWSGGDNPPCLPSVADVVQSPLTASGTSQQSAAFATGTTLVVVDSDEKVHVAFGANPTATTSYVAIPAGARAEFNLTGAGQKVAVIAGA
jgi:hypothetical protein